jgi:hypothetical protein
MKIGFDMCLCTSSSFQTKLFIHSDACTKCYFFARPYYGSCDTQPRPQVYIIFGTKLINFPI